jgi:hypothetical protein
VATIVPHYVRLLLFPAALSADYYPQVITLATRVTPLVLLGGAMIVALAAGIRRAWRPAPELALALLWVPIALAPVSNVFFPSVALAERTLYLPSVGACLALGWALQRAALRAHAPALIAAGVALFLATARTWTRTPAWRSDKTYVLTLLRDRPESYRGHLVAGRVLAATGNLPAAAREYEVARRLWTKDAALYVEGSAVVAALGDQARAAALLDSARALPAPRIVRRSPRATPGAHTPPAPGSR